MAIRQVRIPAGEGSQMQDIDQVDISSQCASDAHFLSVKFFDKDGLRYLCTYVGIRGVYQYRHWHNATKSPYMGLYFYVDNSQGFSINLYYFCLIVTTIEGHLPLGVYWYANAICA